MFLRILLILFCFLSGSLWADRIRLKNGTEREGKVLSVSKDTAVFLENGKKGNIKLEEIESIQVGYEGIPICLDYRWLRGKECSFLLYKFTKDQILFVDKNAPMDLKTLPLAKIKNLTFERDNSGEEKDLTKFFEPGAEATWNTKTYQGRATVSQVKKGQIELMPIEKGSKSISLNEKDIKAFKIKKKKSIAVEVIQETPKLIPGYAPIERRQYWKGVGLFTMAGIASAGMVYEYNEAVNAINNDQEFIPLPDGRVIVASNVISNKNYEMHAQRFVGYGVLLGLTISYSLLDAFYLGQVDNKKGNTSSVWMKVNLSPSISRTEPVSVGASSNHWNYGIEFETRF